MGTTLQSAPVGDTARQEHNTNLQEEYVRLTRELEELEASGGTRLRIRAVKAALEDNQAAFVRANRGLALSAAKRFISVGTGFADDYAQDAMVGLLAARRKWDPAQATFATFARQFIEGELRNGVRRSEYSALSKADFDARPEVLRHERLLEDLQGHKPSDAQIAEATGLKAAQVTRIRLAKTYSLDAPAADTDGDGGMTMTDVVSARMAEGALTPIPDLSWEQKVELTSHFSAKETLVLTYLYGLGGAYPLTFSKIGVLTGFGREPSRKIRTQVWSRLAAAGVVEEIPTWA